MRSVVSLFVEDDLNDAFAIAQVYKGERTEVATPMDPAHQRDHLARVLGSKVAAVVSAFQICQGIQLCHDASAPAPLSFKNRAAPAIPPISNCEAHLELDR